MVNGDLAAIEIFVRNLHLASLVVCAFLVFSADFTASKSTVRHLQEHDFQRLHRYHSLLTKGLVLFWLTGIFLIWRGTAFDPSQFSPKLIAKIIVVTLLTFNAVIIGRVALPFMERNQSLLFGELPFDIRLRLALCGGVSSASWISAFCLGAFKHLKTASPEQLFAFLAPIYVFILSAATLVAIAAAFRKPKVEPVVT